MNSTTKTPAGSDPPHQAFAALRIADYAVYLLASTLAMMADSIEHVISYWMIFDKFHSPALGGYAVISHWLPFLFFSVYSGALADRHDPRRLIQIGMVLFMLCSLAWGMLFLTDRLEVWHAVAILTVHGFAGVLWAPSSQVLIHEIVGREQLHSGVRLMAMSRVLGLLGGPAVGGALLLICGPSVGMLINVLIYVPLTWWLWRAPYGPRFRSDPPALRRDAGGLVGALATMREISQNHVVVVMTLIAGATSLLVGNAYQAQMPQFAADLGHGNADFYYSMLLGANAAGALVAGVLLETFGLLQARTKTTFLVVVLWCLCIGSFAVSTSYPLSLALLFAAGVLNLTYSSMSQTLVQLYAPPASRGRVLGLYSTCANGMRAFAGVSVGMAGSLVGVHRSLAFSAAALVAITLVMFALDLRWRAAAPAE